MKKVLLVVVAMLLVSSVSMAQLSAGKLGVTTDIPASSIGAAYALSENMRIDAGLTFQTTSPPSPAKSSTTIGVGASLKMYNPAMEGVTYFYGGQFNFSSSGPSGATSTALGVAVLGGAEYWFSSRFAVGAHVSFGFGSSTPSGGSATTTIGTMGVGTTWTWWIN